MHSRAARTVFHAGELIPISRRHADKRARPHVDMSTPSYAIQDTPDTVAQHYCRFLPQDKAAIAAQVLNRAWEAA